MRLFTVLVISFVSSFDSVIAQNNTPSDTTNLFDIYRKDKTKIRGKVISRDKEKTVIVTEKNDTISLLQSELLGVVLASNALPNTDKNNFAYKYFISSSSIPVQNNTWHYSNQNLFFNSVHYGISKKLTAGLSVSTFVQFYAAPKIKYCFNPDGKYKIAINAQYMRVVDWTSNEQRTYTFSFAQALITKGNDENNWTLGVGKAFQNTWVNIDYFGTLAFTKKLSYRLSFVSDNSVLSSSINSSLAYLFSAGFRIHRKNHAFDLGVFTPPLSFNFSNVVIPIPFISYSLRVNYQQR